LKKDHTSYQSGEKMFGIEKFSGIAGMMDLIFCIAVVLLCISVPFFVRRIRSSMAKIADRQPAPAGSGDVINRKASTIH